VHLLEVAVGDLVVALGVRVELVVDAEVPPSVGAHAVFLDEAVLLPGRRPVLAALVPVVEDDLPFLDQGPPMVIAPLVQARRGRGRPPDAGSSGRTTMTPWRRS
jgi:hypothetical protein